MKKVEQNGRGEYRGFSEGSRRLFGGFPVFHILGMATTKEMAMCNDRTCNRA